MYKNTKKYYKIKAAYIVGHLLGCPVNPTGVHGTAVWEALHCSHKRNHCNTEK